MFGFGTTKSLGDTSELLNYVSSGDYRRAKDFIESRGYNERELNSISDCYNNNLLHISILNSSNQLITYFLDRGLSYTKLNKFKQSAWDLARISKDNEVLEQLVAFRSKQENPSTVRLSELSSENETLKTKNRELKRLSSGLEVANLELEKKYSLRNRDVVVLSNENTELKTSNKRLREEVLDLKIDVKRLRDENSVLVDKNEKLKVSVETLMNNSRK